MAIIFLSRLASAFRRSARLEQLFIDCVASKRGRTRELYQCTLRRLHAFDPDFRRRRADDITPAWLRRFDAFLALSAPKSNSRYIHLRNLRTVCRMALADGRASVNPFRLFPLRWEPTRKRSLTVAQLRRFADAEVEPWQEKYRDAFLLMFMMRGINVVDFCRIERMEGNYIRYRRSKTGRLFEVRVEPMARELIERLRGKGQLLYPLDRVKDYRSYTAKLNKALQRIASGLGSDFPPITSYWARHTWATLASSIGIPKDVIAAGLGHSGHTVTDVYIDFDLRLVHAANRRLIRHIFGANTADSDAAAPDV